MRNADDGWLIERGMADEWLLSSNQCEEEVQKFTLYNVFHNH